LVRRSLIYCSALRSALGSIRQVRTRPTFSVRTRPRFQNLEVLEHRWKRHGQRLRERADRSRGAAQPLQHDPAGRVCQGLEHEIERG
jgi:hypothetical protein